MNYDLKSPKISVIVPVYKVEKYLNQCVDSIIKQSYKNLEIILIDDGSPDNCPRMCDEYGNKDNRIKVVHKENGGLSSARNAGLDIATGEYVGFVDSDDYIAIDMYEVLLSNAVKHKAHIAICYKTNLENDLQLGVEEVRELKKSEALEKMVLGIEFGSHACDKLFSKEILKPEIRFPEGKTYEDLYTIYRWIDKSDNVVLCRSNKYFYRPNSESITSSSYTKSNMNLIYGLEVIGKFYEKNYLQLVKYQKMALVRSSVAILRKMIISNEFDHDAIDYLIKIIKSNIILYYFSPYKVSNKLFATVAAVNFDFAIKLYKICSR